MEGRGMKEISVSSKKNYICSTADMNKLYAIDFGT
jgi:hypothetical protein